MYAIPAALAAALLALSTRPLLSQNLVVGTVVDDATGRPIGGAIASISVGQSQRVTRTAETGEFRFTSVGTARVTLSIRVLGFAPYSDPLDVTPELSRIQVRLRRIAVLDTVRVRAAKQGLYGVVATARDLRPLPNADLKIVGIGGGPVDLDSTGHFFVPIKTVGSYFLRAKANGYKAQTMSVLVFPNNSVEVAFLLDTADSGPNNQLEFAMGLFDDRLKRRGMMSAVVSRTELLERGHKQIEFALLFSRSFAARGLRLGSSICIFVDGVPRPGVPLANFDPINVEAIEVYGSGKNGDRSGTLQGRWPTAAPCTMTGAAAARGDDVVKWVAIWLKQ